jgi:hypothetical protein
LAAKFPKQVGGQPVTNVTTGKFIDFISALSPAEIDTDRQKFATIGINLDTVVFGSASATVSGSTVQILALRVPGQDASKLIQDYALFSPLATGEALSQETSGGKNVSVVRDAGGTASFWMYASGDILWQVNTSDPTAAAAVFAALS